MKRLTKALAIVASAVALAAFAQDAEIVTVRGRGTGVDKTEALKDAYRDAVEQAVGLYVDAEQMVNNEELVKNQILTQSNAYIENYRVAKESTTTNGIVSVTILADVRRRALTKKIRDVMPSTTIQLGDVCKNLHAQIVTDFQANDDALSIIKNELKDLQPLKQLMKLTLKTVTPVVEAVKGDSSLVRLWYPVKVEVDTKKYYNEFVPRWSRILDQIKVAPSNRLELKNNLAYVRAYNDKIAKKFGTERRGRAGIMTRCEEARAPSCYPEYDVLYRYGVALNEEYMGMQFLNILGEDYILHGCVGADVGAVIGIYDEAFHKNRREVRREYVQLYGGRSLISQFDGDSIFFVGLLTSEKGSMFTATLYEVPLDCVNEIVRWQHDTVCNAREGDTFRETSPSVGYKSVGYKLHFAGRDGIEISARAFSLRNLEIMNFACVMLENMEKRHRQHGNGYEYTGGTQLWMITPLVGGFAKSFVKWVSIDVPIDDVAKIGSATISVEE
ncbi:MAG: hypothetical protein IKZ46_15025 [Victivallales bacterium]|nr:hypothetical protein [Victivallales bacterium]